MANDARNKALHAKKDGAVKAKETYDKFRKVNGDIKENAAAKTRIAGQRAKHYATLDQRAGHEDKRIVAARYDHRNSGKARHY